MVVVRSLDSEDAKGLRPGAGEPADSNSSDTTEEIVVDSSSLCSASGTGPWAGGPAGSCVRLPVRALEPGVPLEPAVPLPSPNRKRG